MIPLVGFGLVAGGAFAAGFATLLRGLPDRGRWLLVGASGAGLALLATRLPLEPGALALALSAVYAAGAVALTLAVVWPTAARAGLPWVAAGAAFTLSALYGAFAFLAHRLALP